MRRVATTTLFAAAFVLALGAGQTAVAISSFFDVFTELMLLGPPYPTAPVSAAVATEEGGLYLNHRQLDLGVEGCTNGLGTLLATRCSGHEGGGGGGGGYQIQSFFDIWLDAGTSPPPVSFFEVFVHEKRWGTGAPGTLGVLHPEKPLADPGRYFDVHIADSFFDIFFDVYYDTTIEHYSMHGSTQAGVCSFFDVFLELNSTVPSASFFDVVVELHSAGGPLDPMLPALTIATSALHDVHPIGVEPATWTAVKSLFGR